MDNTELTIKRRMSGSFEAEEEKRETEAAQEVAKAVAEMPSQAQWPSYQPRTRQRRRGSNTTQTRRMA